MKLLKLRNLYLFARPKYYKIKLNTLYSSTFKNFSQETDKTTTPKETINKKEDLIIDIGSNKKSFKEKAEGKVTLAEFYSPKSVKMGPPDINKFIDRSRITNPNVSLGNYNKTKFIKSTVHELVPISPVFEPFEVRYRNKPNNLN